MIVHGKEKILFNAIYFPILCSAMYVLYEYEMGYYITEHGFQGRADGVFGNPNALGIIANMGLIMTIYSLLVHERLLVIKLFLIPCLLFVSYVSLSRASIITSLVLILFSVFWMIKKFKYLRVYGKFLVGLIIPVIAGITFYTVMNFSIIYDRYIDFGAQRKIQSVINLVFKGEFTYESTSGRTEIFEHGFFLISQHPLIGNGLGAFQHFPPASGFSHGIHNTYLLILGDAGILPFILLLVFILYQIANGLVMRSFIGILGLGFLGIWLLGNMSGHNGLDDKMNNIILIVSCIYLIYGRNQNRYANHKVELSRP